MVNTQWDTHALPAYPFFSPGTLMTVLAGAMSSSSSSPPPLGIVLMRLVPALHLLRQIPSQNNETMLKTSLHLWPSRTMLSHGRDLQWNCARNVCKSHHTGFNFDLFFFLSFVLASLMGYWFWPCFIHNCTQLGRLARCVLCSPMSRTVMTIFRIIIQTANEW